MIDQEQYVRDAVRTENTPPEIRYSKRAVLAILGAHIATGQMVDQLKKHLIYGKPVDPAKRRAALAQVNRSLELLQNSDQPPEPLPVNPRVFHAVVGMATESVEMLEALLKAIEGERLDYVNLAEELGDAAWYEAILLDETGADKGEILDRNIAKLKARYGDKFTRERASIAIWRANARFWKAPRFSAGGNSNSSANTRRPRQHELWTGGRPPNREVHARPGVR